MGYKKAIQLLGAIYQDVDGLDKELMIEIKKEIDRFEKSTGKQLIYD